MNEQNQYSGMHAGAKPELFRFAEELRERMTESEKKLWLYLRKKPLGYKFRRQHPFSLYILDFYCHKVKLAIEVDGQYHDYKKQKELDNKRTSEINQLGLNELRFRNIDVLEKFETVVRTIESYLKHNSEGLATL